MLGVGGTFCWSVWRFCTVLGLYIVPVWLSRVRRWGDGTAVVLNDAAVGPIVPVR